MNPATAYAERVNAGILQPDPDQQAAMDRLQTLHDELVTPLPSLEKSGSLVRWLHEEPPQGLYLWGTVGRGKSCLMDLFFETLPPELPARRVHFHGFMEELHQRMHDTKPPAGVDLVHQIVSDIAQDACVLCFDEFYVTNIADAMLLGRFLQKLISCGVVLLATSNWAPGNLYQDGHNRERFFPFMKTLQQNLQEVPLGDGQDYRRLKEKGEEKRYFLEPVDLCAKLTHATGDVPLKDKEITLYHMDVETEWLGKDSACIRFNLLCEDALGREHYLELAEKFNTIAISHVPQFVDASEANAVLRFITLVDILYEAKRTLLLETATSIEDLCQIEEVKFPFQRTVSRLVEMATW